MTAHRSFALLLILCVCAPFHRALLAYGPTPDELERVSALGPQAYIDEQMKPESIIDPLPFETVTTNFGSGWQQFTVTNTANSASSVTYTNLYVYLNVPGDCFIDDI